MTAETDTPPSGIIMCKFFYSLVVLPKGLCYLRAQVPLILEDAEQPLTVVARDFIHRLYRELVGHDKQIDEIEKELAALVKQNDNYQRLLTIPGVTVQVMQPTTGVMVFCSACIASFFCQVSQVSGIQLRKSRERAGGYMKHL